MKEKIAISVDEGLLSLIDSKVDGSILRSRSQAIEYFLTKGLSDETITTAVLLLRGADQGVALSDFKGGKLIDQQLAFFSKHGITRTFLLSSSVGRELREHLRGKPVTIVEGESRGNASALLSLKGEVSAPFLVMSGDTYNEFDLSRMVSKHLSQKKIGTMGLMTREHSSDYGTAILDGDLIIDFREKKGSSHIVNAGIYLFTPEIFELLEGKSLEKDVFPKLAKIKQLVGFFTYGDYEHLG